MADENTVMQKISSSTRDKLINGIENSDHSNKSSSNVEISPEFFITSIDVISYLSSKTFSNGDLKVQIENDGIYINGFQAVSGISQVVSFSPEVALVRINLIPSGFLNIYVYPNKGKIVDGSGVSYYVL